MGTHRHPNASVDGIWPISSLKGKVLAPGGRSGQIFEILGETGDIINSLSMSNCCDGPYIHLGICVNKVLSAWAEVWSGNYRARPSIMGPGGRSGQIFQFVRFLARLVT